MRISIISTIYNKEKYLEDHIKSVINQDYKDIEFILVNDGSTDNSLEILEKYKKIDNRIKVINQKNQGPSFARRNGFIKSTGDLIYFIDSDDTLYDNMSISKIVKIFNDHPNIDFTISTIYNSYDRKDVLDKIIYSHDIKNGLYDISYLYDKSFRLSLCCKVFKRKHILLSDFIDLRVHEDGILSYKVMSRTKKFYYDEIPLYVVNRKSFNDGRITSLLNIQSIENKYKALKEISKSNKFDISIKKLYLKSYLDDLNYSLNLNSNDKKELLKIVNYNIDKNIIDRKYLIHNKHYIRIYNFKALYNNNITSSVIYYARYILKKVKGVIKYVIQGNNVFNK